MSDVIVVEGVHDEIKIKSVFPDAFCVITNGSEISEDTLKYIKKLSETHGIIIFTDPDSPGERIRSEVLRVVPNAKNAFINKKYAISSNNKKVGVEHASKEMIKNALIDIYNVDKRKLGNITNLDLFSLGLNGNDMSAIYRERISDILNIGRPNNKSFLKRINEIGLTLEELKELLCQVKSELKQK